MVNIEYAKAFSQVLYILENMDKSLVNKIPKKVIEVLKENTIEEADNKLEYTGDIKELNLDSKACAVLAIIYLNCLCSQEEKEEYMKVLQENDKLYQDIENNKLGFDDVFSNKSENEDNNVVQSTDMIEQKEENIFVKVINKIKKFFKFK